jgi:site-specific DNA-methyltransferase (adenine-specific)
MVTKKKRNNPHGIGKPYFSDEGGEFVLYRANSLEVMNKLPEGSVHMIFADPPYFLSNGGMTCKSGRRASVDKGNWDKSQGPEQNHEFNRLWLEACQRVLHPDGTLFVSGTRHVIFSVGFAMQQLGFKLLNDISWYKVTPPPNLSCRYFTHSTETILWAAKNSRSKHYFDYAAMKSDNGGKQMRSLWCILPPRKKEKRFGKHPTQKPVALLDRVVRASTQPGDVVLDPFNGSGTTGVAAALLKRQYVGVDLEQKYLKLTLQRYRDLEGEPNLDELNKKRSARDVDAKLRASARTATA